MKIYSPTTFRFGGGDKKVSKYRWRIPVTIGRAHAYLMVAVLEDFMLQSLIGKDALVEMGANIDFSEGCMSSEIIGLTRLKLKETKGGHYQVEVLPSAKWKKPENLMSKS